jgi:hypothetical protein
MRWRLRLRIRAGRHESFGRAVCGLGALQYFIHVIGSTPIVVFVIDTVACQTSRFGAGPLSERKAAVQE